MHMRDRLLCGFLLLVFSAIPASAQNTTVTGTITDVNTLPYSSAISKAQLVTTAGSPVTGQPTVTVNNTAQCNAGGFGSAPCQLPFPGTVSFTLDANGNLPGGGIQLANNTLVTPAGTQWLFTFNETPGIPPPGGTGPQTCTQQLTISGVSQSVSLTTCPALSKVTGGGGTAINSIPGTAGLNAVPVTSGLIAEYRILNTESPGALVDYSGNSNTGGATTGVAPTIIAGSGGISCGGAGAINLPATLNGALTVQVYMNFNTGTSNTPATITTTNIPPTYQAIVAGNGTLANTDIFGLAQVSNTGSIFQNYIPIGYGGAHPLSGNGSGGVYNGGAYAIFNGTGSMAWVLGAIEQFYIGSSATLMFNSTTSAGLQTSGNYQLCGVTGKFFPGKIYYVAVYNRALAAWEIASNATYLAETMAKRGVPVSIGGTDQIDEVVLDGDSLSAALAWPTPFMVGTFAITDQGFIGGGITNPGIAFGTTDIDPIFRINATRNVDIEWYGSNDPGNGYVNEVAGIANYCRQRHAAGWKCIVTTSISRTGQETYKDNLNNLMRADWPQFADGLVDMAANVNLGADGACSNTTYFQIDCIHLTTFSNTNLVGYNFVHAFNRSNGNPLNGSPGIYAGTGTSVPYVVQLQQCANGSGSGATVSCTFPFASAGGNFIFVNANCAQTVSNVTSIADGTNTYNIVTAAGHPNGVAGNGTVIGEYAMNITAGGPRTITATFSASCVASYIAAYEYSGVATAAALDVTSVMATGNNTTPTTASITTGAANELMITYAGLSNNLASQDTAGNSSTIRVFLGNNSYFQDRIAKTAGAYTGTFTLNNADNWTAATVAFKTQAATTTTIPLADTDVSAQCDPTGGNVNILLPDGSWDTATTLQIKNIQTAGANTCTVTSITPPQTGVAQLIDGAASVTIANKATLRIKPNLTFTGVLGTNYSPVVNWIVLQNN